jgi:hypothetical protein
VQVAKLRTSRGGGVSDPVFFSAFIPKAVQIFKDPNWVRTDILLSNLAKEWLAKFTADAQLVGAAIVPASPLE